MKLEKNGKPLRKKSLGGDNMGEFIFDVMLLIIGIIIGRGYTLDQIEGGDRQ